MILHSNQAGWTSGRQPSAAKSPATISCFRHGVGGSVQPQRGIHRVKAVATDADKASGASAGEQAAHSTAQQALSSRTILLAVDESAESEYALQWALSHLHRTGDSFKLMHCVPSLPPGRLVAVPGAGLLRTPRVDPALLAEKAAAQADTQLASKLLAQLEQQGVQGSFEVLRGPAASGKASISAALCRQTQAEGAAAIVIGSQSRGGLKEALLGSIAANLAHNCEAPVVILHKPGSAAAGGREQPGAASHSGDVTWLLSASTEELLGEAAAMQLDAGAAGQQGQQQPQPAGAERSLVVAIDDSEEGLSAVGWVLQHLRRPGDVLHLLHVVPALPAHMSYSLAPDGMLYSLPLPQVEEAQVEESHWRELLLQRFGPLLQANQVQFQLDVLTDYGSDPLQGVAAAVVATAERLGAAALVVCGHSKGTFAEWLLGSVSDFAVHHSAVPVVVLHGSKHSPGAL